MVRGETQLTTKKYAIFFRAKKVYKGFCKFFVVKTELKEKSLGFFVNNLRVFIASAKGASESENFRLFRRKAAYDVLFFKFHGGG